MTSTDPAPILYTVDNGVATITLNRPEAMNAYSSALGQGLEDAYREADADADVRAVIVTGQGRAFCAGADFSGGKDPFGGPSDRGGFRSDPFEFHAWDVRKPVIAAINGHAVGIGLTMTLHCDIRIMATEGKYGLVQTRRGVMGDLRSHWTIPRLVGHGRAAELILTGRMFTAVEAAEWGMAIAARPADEVLPAAQAMARDIAVNVAPRSAAISKRLLWSEGEGASARINELERLGHLDLMGAPDAREGMVAFLEKRPPQWQGSPNVDWPEWIQTSPDSPNLDAAPAPDA